MTALGKQAHGLVLADHHHPVAVVLDFMQSRLAGTTAALTGRAKRLSLRMVADRPSCKKCESKIVWIRNRLLGPWRELRMREMPSIIPGAPEDYYIVINDFGALGQAFVETDLDHANYETTVSDLLSGQHSDPVRVIMFNPETGRSEDASHSVAQEVLRRLSLEDRLVPAVLEDFIDRHAGSDRQLTLRLL
ncbi:hypothetical protein CQ14_07005 [Bradyrhizobium lablabi]|uniref:Uncharacterized protein n=1 Tax=Bradyrhizobium lablabi TaxID=722472 RepID=A0A0R3MT89_9BRAD|nr:hypothetical protein [Bradyrhizobium lablabi]KRR21391.1 hypothetical protein CQ14_07005 [Bradyrhizobium lablabi]